MSENRRTSSIARKISFSWFFRTLFLLLFLDILGAALMVTGVLYSFEKSVYADAWTPELQRNISWDANAIPDSITFHVTDGVSGEQLYPLGASLVEGAPFFAVLVGAELLLLLPSLFTGKRRARRLLGPLNRMARETRELSRAAQALEQFQSLEDAIGRISPDRPDEQLSTGSSELRGMEKAINDLLARMHKAYRQQAQFVSDASHELRTPIAVIQGYAGMLDRWGKSDPKVLDESVSAIKSESEYMNRLVEQLLFLARGDVGRNPIEKKCFSLTDMLREVCEESAMIDPKHDWLAPEGADVQAYADPAMLKQCARILTENAVRYTPAGGRIVLRTGTQSGCPYFSVQDTGIGVAEKDISRIFDRFYRSDPARGRENGGTGLGLSIAKWIVDRHGGHFEVLSREGLGTRFTVCLPQVAPDESSAS